jgi:hypothetical protein
VRHPGEYAKGTQVAVEQTQLEIRKLLKAAGVSAIVMGFDEEAGCERVQFRLAGYRIRFSIPLLDAGDFAVQNRGAVPDRRRSPAEQQRALEQAEREQWRALWLAIKSKLVNVHNGFEVEDEFLAQIINPETGLTVKEEMTPQLREAYQLPAPSVRLAIEGGK